MLIESACRMESYVLGFILIFIKTSEILGLEEERFNLNEVRGLTGESNLFLHIIENSKPQPICLNSITGRSISLLSHQLCRELGFQTYSSAHPRHIDQFSVSTDTTASSSIECSQDRSNYSISCIRIISTQPCSFFLQVACGDCHRSEILRETGELTISSPLYPVLQPYMICQYDLQVEKNMRFGELVIDKLSLSDPIPTSQNSGSYCLNSFLQIQGGENSMSLRSVETLCGEIRNQSISIQDRFIRLVLVTGGKPWGLSGFKITVLSSGSIPSTASKIFLFFVTFFCVFIGLGSFLFCIGCLVKTKMTKKRQLRSMWRGELPRHGETIHMNRTRRLRRMGATNENNYVMDNRVHDPISSLGASTRTNPPIPSRTKPFVSNKTNPSVPNRASPVLFNLTNQSNESVSTSPDNIIRSGTSRSGTSRSGTGSASSMYPPLREKKRSLYSHHIYQSLEKISRRDENPESFQRPEALGSKTGYVPTSCIRQHGSTDRVYQVMDENPPGFRENIYMSILSSGNGSSVNSRICSTFNTPLPASKPSVRSKTRDLNAGRSKMASISSRPAQQLFKLPQTSSVSAYPPYLNANTHRFGEKLGVNPGKNRSRSVHDFFSGPLSKVGSLSPYRSFVNSLTDGKSRELINKSGESISSDDDVFYIN
ncbi:uncharacterized protein LOC111702276 isoform X2 [Eurytemora carolleeae]|uniref:uncharacterized protein LOC111702276 isoform X2 n=1 Tax=Eurytemora carolleeae TaxID=1294199 RepID=UPI000C775AAB|nr:uncharacterized protein LOC111702276 isoform X2 [Eurytemora carolleeae]|eukprot:XP_023329681.1 uncharacterized protein LOC111702276 isoform X2 [Eurytemora affinis]